jgi:hypothetical protein
LNNNGAARIKQVQKSYGRGKHEKAEGSIPSIEEQVEEIVK